jgi:hypothetical protein
MYIEEEEEKKQMKSSLFVAGGDGFASPKSLKGFLRYSA